MAKKKPAPVRLTPEQLHACHRWILLDEISTLPGNANLGHEESLKASLDEFGWFDGIVIHGGQIIAGNHRYDMAVAAGEEGLPGYDLSEYPIDDMRKMAMAITHNETTRAGQNDIALLATAMKRMPVALRQVVGIDRMDPKVLARINPKTKSAPVADCPIYLPPFQWFGGKGKVAPWIWAALGDVDNYVEPFAGSLAVLMRRPLDHGGIQETVNDYDGFVANWWRAAKWSPTEVAEHTNWPVTENDLHARRAWLAEIHPTLSQRLEGDPEWHDPKIAGWWAWAQSATIGSFSFGGPWRRAQRDDGTWTLEKSAGVGAGGSRGIPDILSYTGVNRSRPHLSEQGLRGSDVQAGEGIEAGIEERQGLMDQMAQRLRHTRVTCGDWSRVCTTGALASGNIKGIFLDPPYANEGRSDVYIHDDGTVAADCREWALEHGDDPTMRIILAGYIHEHDEHFPKSWTRLKWSTGGGMSKAGGRGKANSTKETLWLSPHCYTPDAEIPDGIADPNQ